MADLAALLDSEASAEIEAIRSEARARASEIVAEAESEAEAITASRERSAKQQRDAALVRARSAAQLEAASLKLNAQQKAIESVFDAASAQLASFAKNDDRWSDALATLLDEAVEAAGGADNVAHVAVHPSDEAAAQAAAKAAGVNAPIRTDDSIVGGVRVTAKNRTVVANTLTGRLDALRDELASEVAAALLKKDA